MAKIDSNAELQEAIQVLESKQKEDLKSLKKEFTDVKERLKPKNLIKQGISNISHSSALRNTLIVAATGILSFIAVKKIRSKRRKQHEKKMNYQQYQHTSGASSKSKKLTGSIVKYIITAILSQNADKLRSLAYRLLSNLKTKPPKHTGNVHRDTATSASAYSSASGTEKSGY